jgi:hypothetical protein
MKKSYLVVAVLLMFGLNLLYRVGTPHIPKGPVPAEREPAAVQTGKTAEAATTPHPTASPTRESENRIWLRKEAARVGHVDPKPTDTLEQLRQRASRLTENDRAELKDVAASPDQPADERFLAVFVLSETPGASGGDQLKALSELPITKTDNDRQYSDELVIRMQALEAYVKRLSPSEAKSFLHGYVSRITDPQLAKHARTLQK